VVVHIYNLEMTLSCNNHMQPKQAGVDLGRLTAKSISGTDVISDLLLAVTHLNDLIAVEQTKGVNRLFELLHN
jgi:hypothetical protein